MAYYTATGKAVSDGDTAKASDLNTINTAIEAFSTALEAYIASATGNAALGTIDATGDITTTGNVGIGIASPAMKLHIKDATATIRIEDSDQAGPAVPWDIQVDGTDFYIKEQANSRTILKATAAGVTSLFSAGVERVTIGATGSVTLSDALAVTGETTLGSHLNMGDSDIIRLGASNDLQIYHDGSNSVIAEGGTGALIILGTNLVMQSTTGEEYIGCTAEGGVDLSYDNLVKLTTTATGVTVTGDATATTFIGNLTGNADTATTAATVTTAAQPAITSVGTLSSLAVTTTATVGTSVFGDGYLNHTSGGYNVSLGSTGASDYWAIDSNTLRVDGYSHGRVGIGAVPGGDEALRVTSPNLAWVPLSIWGATSQAVDYFSCKNSGGAHQFRVEADGDLYGAKDIRLDGGIMQLSETTTPTPVANFGKIYCKADNRLYFQDGAGVEHAITVDA